MTKQMQDVPEDKVYDLGFLKNLGNHDDDFIRNLQEVFIKTIPLTVSQMVAACEQKNWINAGKLAHKLKASTDMFNIILVKEKIRFIEEHSATEKNPDAVTQMALETQEILKLAAEQMQQNL